MSAHECCTASPADVRDTRSNEASSAYDDGPVPKPLGKCSACGAVWEDVLGARIVSWPRGPISIAPLRQDGQSDAGALPADFDRTRRLKECGAFLDRWTVPLGFGVMIAGVVVAAWALGSQDPGAKVYFVSGTVAACLGVAVARLGSDNWPSRWFAAWTEGKR